MLRRIQFVALILLIGLAACSGSPDKTLPGTLTTIRLPMGYIPNVQYAPFYVAVEKGYFQRAGLEVEFDYSFETDGVALVGADELQFALVSGEQVLLARAQGLPVVYILGWWQDFPVAVAAKPEIGLVSPADLKGKKIGLPGLFGANYVGLRALLDAGGLKEEDVTLDSIGFNQVEALLADQEQIVVVYANNEPYQLKAQGQPVDVLLVADYIQLASNGLITNEVTIRENPDLVRRMVQAVLKGLEDTIANPEAAFEVCKKYVEGLDLADEALQMDILLASLDFWKADELGYSNPQAWQNMNDVLLGMGMISTPLDLDKAFTNEFVENE